MRVDLEKVCAILERKGFTEECPTRKYWEFRKGKFTVLVGNVGKHGVKLLVHK